MERFAYTTVDRVLASLQRSTGEEDVAEETLIEWIGEALGDLYRRGSLQECTMIALVDNYTVTMPEHFKYISGILRNRNYTPENNCGAITPKDILSEESDCTCEQENCVCLNTKLTCYLGLGSADSETFLRKDINHTLYGIPVPFMSLNSNIGSWYASHTCQSNFEKVNLADSRFFKSQVLKDGFGMSLPHPSSPSEYTLAGQSIKFSFPKGQVAISFLKVPIDSETGYPLIPDESSYIRAITYYLRWKLAEFYDWTGRVGFVNKIEVNFKMWEKYAAQARVKTIKTRTKDEADLLIRNQSNFFDTSKY